MDSGLAEDFEVVVCILPGELKKGTIPFHIDRKGIHVTFDSVPAMICRLCGQALFEEAEMKAIDEIVADLDKKSRKLERAARSSSRR